MNDKINHQMSVVLFYLKSYFKITKTKNCYISISHFDSDDHRNWNKTFNIPNYTLKKERWNQWIFQNFSHSRSCCCFKLSKRPFEQVPIFSRIKIFSFLKFLVVILWWNVNLKTDLLAAGFCYLFIIFVSEFHYKNVLNI